MNRYAISLFFVMSIVTSPATVLALNKQKAQSNQNVKGSWNLTLTRSASPPRTIELTHVGSTIQGAYIAKDGQRKSISSARISNGYFYFRVTDLSLFFEMRFVDTRLEGTMTDYGSSVKKPAEPVRMVRQISRAIDTRQRRSDR